MIKLRVQDEVILDVSLNPHKRQNGGDRHRQGPREDRGRDWSHRKLEETGLILP